MCVCVDMCMCVVAPAVFLYNNILYLINIGV
jgi:hypothetical protein